MNLFNALKLSTLVASLALSAAACSGDGGGGGAIDIDDLATELTDTICEAQVRCGYFPDRASCEVTLGLQTDQLVADVKAGLIEYDGKKARDCIEGQFSSDCSITNKNAQGDDEACDLSFIGTVAIGGNCFSDEVCAGQASCEDGSEQNCTQGTCVADTDPEPKPAKVGESCAENVCESGLYCDDADVCKVLASPGEACAGFAECVGGYICELGPDFTPGVCIKIPKTGETCDPAFGSPFAAGQLSCLYTTDYCDPSDNKCKAKLPAGSACGEGLENACVDYAPCLEGTCVAKPLLGESCVADSALDCLGGLDCENGKCVGEPPAQVCSL